MAAEDPLTKLVARRDRDAKGEGAGARSSEGGKKTGPPWRMVIWSGVAFCGVGIFGLVDGLSHIHTPGVLRTPVSGSGLILGPAAIALGIGVVIYGVVLYEREVGRRGLFKMGVRKCVITTDILGRWATEKDSELWRFPAGTTHLPGGTMVLKSKREDAAALTAVRRQVAALAGPGGVLGLTTGADPVGGRGSLGEPGSWRPIEIEVLLPDEKLDIVRSFPHVVQASWTGHE